MNMRTLLFLILGLALVLPEFVDAQASRRRPSKSRSGDAQWDLDEEPAKEKKEKTRKKKQSKDRDEEEEPEEKAAGPMSSKAEIEAHLRARIKMLKQYHEGQMAFGRRVNTSWIKFWDKIYEDRKLFDVHMGRQRLNFFESLSSLDPASHREQIVNFERLQAGQVRSFEAELESRMTAFLSQLMGDLKNFTAEQESKRMEFREDLKDSWRDQKERKERKKKR